MPTRVKTSSRLDLPSTTQSVPMALVRAREKIMEPIRVMLAPTGITEQQWRVLRVLEEFGPLDPTKLADRACLLLPSQTRIVQTLVAKGLATREPHPTDRRRQSVAITRAGRKVLEDHLEQAHAIASRVERGLGRKKLRTLLRILAELGELQLDSADSSAGRERRHMRHAGR